jgi:peptidoglycan/xylan/chitin deacetylase (PgdA/CDA1 family)
MIDRILKLIIATVYYGFYKTFSLILVLLGKRSPGTRVVLTYHSVKTGQIDIFRKQMDVILRAGRAVKANTEDSYSHSRRRIAVTFDDGFKSVLENALPILHERKIPITIFVTTGYLGKQPGWIQQRDHENANEPLINEEQLSNLTDKLVTVGSHSVMHLHLGEIDQDRAVQELVESKNSLERITGKSIHLFSFPYGSYSKKTLELAGHAGYGRVFSNVPVPRWSNENQFVEGRVNVSLNDYTIEYWLKVRGAYEWLSWAVIVKRGLRGLIKKARIHLRGCA